MISKSVLFFKNLLAKLLLSLKRFPEAISLATIAVIMAINF
jgi:hypothetical protein